LLGFPDSLASLPPYPNFGDQQSEWPVDCPDEPSCCCNHFESDFRFTATHVAESCVPWGTSLIALSWIHCLDMSVPARGNLFRIHPAQTALNATFFGTHEPPG
jgi:hypothetical protein